MNELEVASPPKNIIKTERLLKADTVARSGAKKSSERSCCQHQSKTGSTKPPDTADIVIKAS